MTLNNQVLNLRARQILIKTGNGIQASSYVGPMGELVFDNSLNTLRIHDGVTVGGIIVPTGLTASTFSNTYSEFYSNLYVTSAITPFLGLFTVTNAAISNLTTTLSNTIGNIADVNLRSIEAVWHSLNFDANFANVTNARINGVQANVVTEQTRALAAENSLLASIALEANARINSDNAINVAIINTNFSLASEIAGRTANDAILTASINSVQANVTAEAVQRISEDTSLQANIVQENSLRTAAIANVYSHLASNVAALDTRIDTLESTESFLVNSIATMDLLSSGDVMVPGAMLPKAHLNYDLGSPTSSWRSLYLSNSTMYLGSIGISAHPITGLNILNASGVSLPVSGNVRFPDGTTQYTAFFPSFISNLQTNLDLEKTERISNVNNLQTQINNLINNSSPGTLDSLAEIVYHFSQADGNLLNTINTLSSGVYSAIGLEQARATSAESVLQGNILLEASQRYTQDLILASSISAVNSNLNTTASSLTSLTSQVSGIQANINAVAAGLTTETSARQANVAALNTRIDNIILNTDPAALDSLSELVSQFTAADNSMVNLLGNIAFTYNTALYNFQLDLSALALNLGITDSNLAAANSTIATTITRVGALETRSTVLEANVGILFANANVQQNTIDTLVGNAAAQQTTINTLVANAAAQQTTIDTLVSNAAAQQTTIDTLVANASAQQTTINTLVSNASTQQTTIDTLVANASAQQTTIDSLVSNASAQQTTIDSLVSNAAAQQTTIDSLVSNAAAQQTTINTLVLDVIADKANITTLLSNAISQQTTIDTLVSNAAAQQTTINTLTGNASTQQTAIDALVGNAITQQSELSTLFANAVAQQTTIDTLVSNAAAQQTTIDSLTSNAASQQTTIDTLVSNAAAQQTTIDSLTSNAAAQQTSLNSLLANVNQAVNTTSSPSFVGISLSSTATANIGLYGIGYREVPQVVFASSATAQTTDSGKHYYSTSATNLTLTIDTNANQPFIIGTAITIVNRGTGTISVSPAGGVSLYMVGNTTPADRSILSYGMATIMKVETNTWMINGTGVF